MGTYAQLVDFDKLYRERSGGDAVIINDVPSLSEDDTKKLESLIFTRFSGDLLSNVPSCECGEVNGEYNMNVRCVHCGTVVKPIFDQDLEPITWLRAPRGVRALINPLIWTMLKNRFKSGFGKFNIIQWLCDTTYAPTAVAPKKLYMVEQIMIKGKPIGRGLNYFIDNFDDIMQELFEHPLFRKNRGKGDNLRRLLKVERDKIFCQYLPIPHRSLLVLEQNDLGWFVDTITTGAMDAVHILAGIDTDSNMFQTYVKENRTVKSINQLSEYFELTYRDTMAGKEGTFRKHVVASRSHFSFRAVVSSLTNAHNYKEIHIPWGVATSVLREHLKNKLLKLDYTPNEAVKFIDEHAEHYNPFLDSLFKELIAEAPSGIGISCTLNRNPSLGRGSIQHVYISHVKTDVHDPTVSLSILIVKALNCDFDGDALQFTLAVDQVIEEKLATLAPHMSVFGIESVRAMSNSASLSKPLVATTAEWIEAAQEPADPVKLERMAALAV